MTKSDAIHEAKNGMAVHHPVTQGFIKLEVTRDYFKGDVREVRFYGDCSAKDGWQVEYLGER